MPYANAGRDAGIEDAAWAFLTPAALPPRMEKTPRYVDGNTRDPRNPPDPDIAPRKAEGGKDPRREA